MLDFTEFKGSIVYRRGRLLVKRDGACEQVSLPLTQIAVVLIGNHASISGAVLTKLSEYDIPLLVCNWSGVPVAGALPWRDHTRIGARQRAQAELTLPRRKNAWGRIVRAKISGQAATIRSVSWSTSEALANLAKTVKSGDPNNTEAVAAKRYWRTVSQREIGFARNPGAHEGGLNGCLDYAYTVLRGHGIRAIVSAGLCGTLAVFHRRRDNPYALVDDLIEPFRPAVDAYVLAHCTEHGTEMGDPEVKRGLVGAVTGVFEDTGETIPTVLTAFCQEYGLYVEANRKTLAVPIWRGGLDACKGE
ncbi:type II CRISPR-associated endonuclease Cas1 [Corynebacterium sp. TAE3-ERU16]|uniref:type II CRISPR-associated endonuclease Cas1 n=1 Tax=Corynebacterium sp. TAE3-ERU16 TaxID=2849493 RepID=UPI00351D69D2